jgi:hypothetical protein
MARTKVNNDYFYNGWLLPFTVQPNVVVNEPIPFRYRNVLKGEFTGSQIIQGWLNVDSSKVIATDEELDKKVKYKFLETKDRQTVYISKILVELEPGIYDPIFGLPFPGTSEDARSVGFVENIKPDTNYQFNLFGVNITEADFNSKGTFGSIASTTGGDVPFWNFSNTTDKGTFGGSSSTTEGDLPSSGNVSGDTYACNRSNFFSDEAQNTFDTGDTATWTGAVWLKNTIIVQANDGYVCDTNDFESDIADITYDIGQIAILDSDGVWGIETNDTLISVLQFDENDQVSSGIDLVGYNQILKTDTDTVKVKVWATNILVDSQGVPLTDYRIGEPELQYVSKSEVLNIQIETIENQKYGIIRGRTDTNEYVIQLS